MIFSALYINIPDWRKTEENETHPIFNFVEFSQENDNVKKYKRIANNDHRDITEKKIGKIGSREAGKIQVQSRS